MKFKQTLLVLRLKQGTYGTIIFAAKTLVLSATKQEFALNLNKKKVIKTQITCKNSPNVHN